MCSKPLSLESSTGQISDRDLNLSLNISSDLILRGIPESRNLTAPSPICWQGVLLIKQKLVAPLFKFLMLIIYRVCQKKVY